VYFDGLKKRMFNIAGKNVYPAEVERLVALNENVVNVTITAQPNGIFGDKLLGTVLLRDGSREQQKLFHDWCVEHITQFKLPRQWTFL
jgi:acyl-coenzyme A synthetase/AMP-(fatty) acid ligase